MKDITEVSMLGKAEIASYIREDTLDIVNKRVAPVVPRRTFYTKYGKRVLDILISLLALIVSLPINLVIAVVTFFDVGKPIIFEQTRVGKNEKKFTIYKFRNMTNETDINGELLPASVRVTKWGRFVRKTSLDELLNFVSILKGDMSVIGPRPLLDRCAERFHDRHRAIFAVRPGLECPTLNKADHILSWQERLDNYVWYVENCSLWIDIRLTFRVIQIAFDHKETVYRSEAGQGGLMGYDQAGNVIYTKSVPDKYVNKYCQNHGYADLQEAIGARTFRPLSKEEKTADHMDKVGKLFA